MMFVRLEKKSFIKGTRGFFCGAKLLLFDPELPFTSVESNVGPCPFAVIAYRDNRRSSS